MKYKNILEKLKELYTELFKDNVYKDNIYNNAVRYIMDDLEYIDGILGGKLDEIKPSEIEVVIDNPKIPDCPKSLLEWHTRDIFYAGYISFHPVTDTGIEIDEVRLGVDKEHIKIPFRNYNSFMTIIGHCGDTIVKLGNFSGISIVIDEPNNPKRGIYNIYNSYVNHFVRDSHNDVNFTSNLNIQYFDGEYLDDLKNMCKDKEELIENLRTNYFSLGCTLTKRQFAEELSDETIFRIFKEATSEKFNDWIMSIFELSNEDMYLSSEEIKNEWIENLFTDQKTKKR